MEYRLQYSFPNSDTQADNRTLSEIDTQLVTPVRISVPFASPTSP